MIRSAMRLPIESFTPRNKEHSHALSHGSVAPSPVEWPGSLFLWRKPMLSQAQVIGRPRMKTWDDYEQGCLASFGGGHRTDGHLEAFQHGMSTVFNLLRHEFPPAEQCKAAPSLLEALRECVTDDDARCMTDESRNAAHLCRRRLSAITTAARSAINAVPASAPEEDLDAWKRANPWILVNTQSSITHCGRYSTREEAVAAANERGGVVSIEGHQVFFSETPRL